MTHPWIKEERTAVRAVRMAARACRAVGERLLQRSAIAKEDRSPVTVADFASQAIICAHLEQDFPQDLVVGEENSSLLRQPDGQGVSTLVVEHVSCEFNAGIQPQQVFQWIDRGSADPLAVAGSSASQRHWTLDPIDGTKGFLRGDQYAIALALIENNQVVLGVLGCPRLSVVSADVVSAGLSGGVPLITDSSDVQPSAVGVLMVAVRGYGTRQLPLWDHDQMRGRPIRVSQEQNPVGWRFCESLESAHSKHDVAARLAQKLGITQSPLRMDSQAKYASVARGDAAIYMKFPPFKERVENVWDHGAGSIVVEEAGGKVTDLAGNPLDFSRGRGLHVTGGIIAANPQAHRRILEQINTSL